MVDQDIYCQDDQSDEEKPIQPASTDVLNPSKAKFNKYLEEIRQRDAVSGTFGEGNTFNFGSVHKVDEACTIENVDVMQDYSCVLTLEDINYNQLS